METLAVQRESVRASALPLQHLQIQHVRKSYPDPVVFDRNGDGRFDAIDIVKYRPTWTRARQAALPAAEPTGADEQKEAASEKQSVALKQYKASTEVEPEHAVEVMA